MKFSFLFPMVFMVQLVAAQTRTVRLPDVERRGSTVFPIGPQMTVQDPLLMALGNPQTRNRAVEQYKERGADAVPGLLRHLQSPNTGIRLLALSALQFAWSPGTETSVYPFLKSAHDAEAKSAWYLLKQKVPEDQFDLWVNQHFFELNPGRMEDVLAELERENPDPSRMLQLLSRDRYWKVALPFLPRYTAKEFSPFTRYIAGQAHGEWLAFAIAGFIHQGDRDVLVMQQMEGMLKNENPGDREMAAEYFRWHGGKVNLPGLEQAVTIENDLFARASMQESIRIISLRGEVDVPAGPTPMEPLVHYAGGVQSEMDSEIHTRIKDLREATGYLNAPPRNGKEAFPWVVVPPVRDFLSDKNSFGFYVKKTEGPFEDSVHVARDVAWGKEMATVLSIAPGVVKRVQVARQSWGGLVVMEHRMPNGKIFCSLYGHLGPLITVQPGDIIPAGVKLGGLGRSYTAENGGYRSHLHFGIYDDAYGNGRWVTGYMDPNVFREGDHKWIDPYRLYNAGKK